MYLDGKGNSQGSIYQDKVHCMLNLTSYEWEGTGTSTSPVAGEALEHLIFGFQDLQNGQHDMAECGFINWTGTMPPIWQPQSCLVSCTGPVLDIQQAHSAYSN